MKPTVRQPKIEETPVLKSIWKTVFGDPEKDIDNFFETYFEPEMTAIADSGSGIAAAAYLLPVGNIRCEDFRIPCAMVYAVATLPEYRDHGFATAVVNELISTGSAAGYKAAVLRPSDESLFEYYSAHTSFKEWFFVGERKFKRTAKASDDKTELTPVAPGEYIILRESMLSGIPHIEFDLRAMRYQEYLCCQSGGGLYRAETTGGPACVIVERSPDDTVCIKELLAPHSSRTEVLSAVASRHPAEMFQTRSPAYLSPASSAKQHFGMITVDAADAEPLSLSLKSMISESRLQAAPYYGPAFD